MSISNSAILVELNISVWTANVVDRAATDKVTRDANASYDAGQFRKNLMAGTTKRKEIANYAAATRTWHNGATMPWSDQGPRITPLSRFMWYKQELNKRKDHFDGLVEDFVANYDQHVQESLHYLGSMANPDDYPSPDEIRSKFAMTAVFSSVPQSGDFRLDLPAEELEQVKRDYDEAYERRLADAMRDPWNKLHDRLTKMLAKVDDSNGGVAKRWGEGFVTGAEALCDTLGQLNLTNDPKLEEARRRLKGALANVYVEDLKEDASIREQMKTKLDNILQDYEW